MQNDDLVIACGCKANAGQMTVKMAQALKTSGVQTVTLDELKEDISPAKNAKGDIIALEGCPIMCVTNFLTPKGINSKPFLLKDYGVRKGLTPITDELISTLLEKLKEKY
jgi:uncharacterized metal-binding protein